MENESRVPTVQKTFSRWSQSRNPSAKPDGAVPRAAGSSTGPALLPENSGRQALGKWEG